MGLTEGSFKVFKPKHDKSLDFCILIYFPVSALFTPVSDDHPTDPLSKSSRNRTALYRQIPEWELLSYLTHTLSEMHTIHILT